MFLFKTLLIAIFFQFHSTEKAGCVKKPSEVFQRIFLAGISMAVKHNLPMFKLSKSIHFFEFFFADWKSHVAGNIENVYTFFFDL